MKTKSNLFLTTLALAASATLAYAQAPQTPQPNDPNRPGGDRTRNFEEFRQRMAERLKTSLKVTDDEWAVIQPLIEKVTTKQREAGGGRGFGGPRGSDQRGGAAGSPGGAPSPGGERSSGSPERDALRTALENESASPEELKAKLTALRESKKKATAELEAVREDLKKVLTVRQEATLVSYGILE
jgi:Spy/CpxP family protein refolding chaperone